MFDFVLTLNFGSFRAKVEMVQLYDHFICG
jgi:hypothetical protein